MFSIYQAWTCCHLGWCPFHSAYLHLYWLKKHTVTLPLLFFIVRFFALSLGLFIALGQLPQVKSLPWITSPHATHLEMWFSWDWLTNTSNNMDNASKMSEYRKKEREDQQQNKSKIQKLEEVRSLKAQLKHQQQQTNTNTIIVNNIKQLISILPHNSHLRLPLISMLQMTSCQQQQQKHLEYHINNSLLQFLLTQHHSFKTETAFQSTENYHQRSWWLRLWIESFQHRVGEITRYYPLISNINTTNISNHYLLTHHHSPIPPFDPIANHLI